MKQKVFSELPTIAEILLACATLCFLVDALGAYVFSQKPNVIIVVMVGIVYMLNFLTITAAAVILTWLRHHHKNGAIIVANGISHSYDKNSYPLTDWWYLIFVWWWVLAIIAPMVMLKLDSGWTITALNSIWDIGFVLALVASFKAIRKGVKQAKEQKQIKG